MSPIKIFGFAGSTYVRSARLVCAEKGFQCELVPLEFRAASHRARHPFLKMPAMEHDGFRLFELLAIADYIDGLSREPKLQPVAPKERAVMLQWASSAIDYVYADLVRSLLADTLPDGASESVRRTLVVLDEALGPNEFFAGAALSLADLFLAPMVDFAARKDAAFAPGTRKHLARWLTAMRSRTSWQATAP
jgi:glutathione S-transferase